MNWFEIVYIFLKMKIAKQHAIFSKKMFLFEYIYVLRKNILYFCRYQNSISYLEWK